MARNISVARLSSRSGVSDGSIHRQILRTPAIGQSVTFSFIFRQALLQTCVEGSRITVSLSVAQQQAVDLLHSVLGSEFEPPTRVIGNSHFFTFVWEFSRCQSEFSRDFSPHSAYAVLRVAKADAVCGDKDACLVGEGEEFASLTPRGCRVNFSDCQADDFLHQHRRSLTHFAVFALNGTAAPAALRGLALVKALKCSRKFRQNREVLARFFPGNFIPEKKIPTLDLRGVVSAPAEADPKEFRAVLSEIVKEKIFLSGALGAQDAEKLSQAGIGRIVNVVASLAPSAMKSIEYCSMDLLDAKDEDIVAFFPAVFEFIEFSDQPLLLHCVEGISRSAALTVGYLMWKSGLPFSRALEIVKAARPTVNPNAGFTCQLLAYQKRLLKESGASDAAIDYRLQERSGIRVLYSVPSLANGATGVKRIGNHFSLFWSIAAEKHELERLVAKLCWSEKLENFDVADFQVMPESVSLGTTVLEMLDAPLEPETLQAAHLSQLFHWPNLEEPLSHFDSDDLDSRSVFVLMHADRTYLWIGSAATDEDVRYATDSVECSQIFREGEETDMFWDLFPDG